jgi:phospholipid/cholesterol/gamma-HCH transport system substrate-binding protein
MKKRPLETVLGFAVLVVAIGFMVVASSKIEVKAIEGYPVNIVFQQAGGLENGSDVRISGLKVGTVTDRYLDEDFNARVKVVVKSDVKLPEDTLAEIMGDGLMGGKFVNLVPGKSRKMLEENATITKVKDFKTLEDSVSEIIFLATKDSK